MRSTSTSSAIPPSLLGLPTTTHIRRRVRDTPMKPTTTTMPPPSTTASTARDAVNRVRSDGWKMFFSCLDQLLLERPELEKLANMVYVNPSSQVTMSELLERLKQRDPTLTQEKLQKFITLMLVYTNKIEILSIRGLSLGPDPQT